MKRQGGKERESFFEPERGGVAETSRSNFALPGALETFNRLEIGTCCGWPATQRYSN
jgi:hypothetical protein